VVDYSNQRGCQPGCSKTALACEISMALRATELPRLSAPQNYWIYGFGGSRAISRDAEAKLASLNGDAMLLT
jgi:hypothetical protein